MLSACAFFPRAACFSGRSVVNLVRTTVLQRQLFGLRELQRKKMSSYAKLVKGQKAPAVDLAYLLHELTNVADRQYGVVTRLLSPTRLSGSEYNLLFNLAAFLKMERDLLADYSSRYRSVVHEELNVLREMYLAQPDMRFNYQEERDILRLARDIYEHDRRVFEFLSLRGRVPRRRTNPRLVRVIGQLMTTQ